VSAFTGDALLVKLYRAMPLSLCFHLHSDVPDAEAAYSAVVAENDVAGVSKGVKWTNA
jgi:hypothetical protein